MKSKLIVLSLFLLTVSLSSYAQRWEKLGERVVNYKTDRDVIKCGHKGTFTALRIHVENSPVEFHDIEVEFMNGSKQRINIREQIRAGGESRVIDLRGNKRVIKDITLIYHTNRHIGASKRKARVYIMGRH